MPMSALNLWPSFDAPTGKISAQHNPGVLSRPQKTVDKPGEHAYKNLMVIGFYGFAKRRVRERVRARVRAELNRDTGNSGRSGSNSPTPQITELG
jgi:hypothetical protein